MGDQLPLINGSWSPIKVNERLICGDKNALRVKAAKTDVLTSNQFI